MSRNVYNKLVRDRIPEIIAATGRQFAVDTLTPDEFSTALKEKLLEEAQEVWSAGSNELLEELADIQEIVEALLQQNGLTQEQLREEQLRRREERGGFEMRLRLLWTE